MFRDHCSFVHLHPHHLLACKLLFSLSLCHYSTIPPVSISPPPLLLLSLFLLHQMLLLVPTQKTNEDGGPTASSQQPNSSSPSHFSPTTATTTHSSALSKSGPISTSSGRVLVVLPSHTDLTSKLTVSDSSVLTTSFLHHSLSSPYSEHHDDSREHGQLMGYSGRRRSHGNNIYAGFYSGMVQSLDPEFDTTTVTGYIDEQRPHRRHSVQAGSMAQSSASFYSPPSSPSTSTPLSSNSPLSQHLSFVDSPFTDSLSRRRHSHLGLALGGSSDSSEMDLDTIARLRHSSSSPAAASSHTNRRSGSRLSQRASTVTAPSLSSLSISSALTTSAYIPTTKSAKMVMASARHATRSFREVFKKSMTVHSPLLTSTSSGMVLDLTPGPEPNFVSSKLRVGGGGGRGVSGSGGGGAMVDVSRVGGSGVGLARSVDSKQHQHQKTSSSRKRSLDEMMKDLDRDGNVGGVNSEPVDTASDSSNSQPYSPTAYHKQQKKGDSNSGHGFDATVTSNGLSALLDVDADSSPPSKKKAAVSRSQSSSPLATTSVSGPVSVPSSSSASQSQSPRGSSSRSSSSSSPTYVTPSPSHSSPAPAPVKADHRIREDDEGVEGEEEVDYHTLNQEREHQGPLDRVVTTQDISAIAASMGALTPLEIQRRLYAHQEKQQKLRKRRLLLHQQQLLQQQQQQFLRGSAGTSVSHHFPNFRPLPTATGDSSQIQTPTTQQQYRGIVGGNHIGTVDPIGRTTSATTIASRTTVMNMTSPYQQQPYPPYLFTRHPQGHQTQPQTQGPPLVQHPSPLSTSAAATTSASMAHPLHPLYQQQNQHPYHPQHQQQQQQQQQLPSCYYLPPSAFRTASAVAAEEHLEDERKRKELLHLAATTTAIDGEEQTKERKADQELEEDKKMKRVEEEEGEEFLIFPSPTLP